MRRCPFGQPSQRIAIGVYQIGIIDDEFISERRQRVDVIKSLRKGAVAFEFIIMPRHHSS